MRSARPRRTGPCTRRRIRGSGPCLRRSAPAQSSSSRRTGCSPARSSCTLCTLLAVMCAAYLAVPRRRWAGSSSRRSETSTKPRRPRQWPRRSRRSARPPTRMRMATSFAWCDDCQTGPPALLKSESVCKHLYRIEQSAERRCFAIAFGGRERYSASRICGCVCAQRGKGCEAFSQASTDNVNECDVCGCALLARPPWLREIAYIQWTRCKQA